LGIGTTTETESNQTLAPQDVRTLREEGNRRIYPSTLKYLEGHLDTSDLMRCLQELAAAPHLLNPTRVCALYGYGGGLRSHNRYFRTAPGIELVWHNDFGGPWWALPLRLIFAWHGGLIRILDGAALADPFVQLGAVGMEVYSFRADIWDRVVDHARNLNSRSLIGTVIGAEDSTYFCLGTERNHPDDEGYVVWVSYGSDCPDDLKRVVET
jgi:hypothetical protein